MLKRILFLLILISSNSIAAEILTVSGDAERGRAIFVEKRCWICHSINRDGGVVGPDLTQVALRRSDERLAKWLNDPPSILKDTDMPKVPWTSQQDVFDLISFLKTFKREVDKSFIGKVSKLEAGKMLIEEYDCKACHRIRTIKSGRERYPDLSHEGDKRDKKWLDEWLKDPQAVKPGTFMPAYPLTDEEREAIVEYLSTLKSND